MQFLVIFFAFSWIFQGSYANLQWVGLSLGNGLVPNKQKAISRTNDGLDHEPICVSPGGRLNIKTVLSTYGDFHVKDKTAVRTSYL